jgi:ABC-type transport system substrate-binding protein
MISGAPTNFHTVVQEQLGKIGVTVKFDQLESAVVNGHKVNRTYPDALGSTDSQRGYHGVRQAFQAFLPSSPQNFGNVDDPKLVDMIYKASRELDVDRQYQLLKEVNDYASDIAFAIETFSAFQCLLYQPWTRNLCQSPTGWVTATGGCQYPMTYVTDTAPEDRRGKLKT